MSPFRGPNVRQRRLAAELRRLREQKGLTGDDVAERLAWSTAKVSRLENARTGAKIDDIHALIDLYDIAESHRSELIALAHDAAEKGWWEGYRELPGGYSALIALEDEANKITQWETYIVPGLLQTEAYARATISGLHLFDTVPPREIDRRVEVRMRRQGILHRAEPVEYTVLLDESVLQRLVGDHAVMRAQLDHLLEVAEMPNVTLRVLRLGVAHPLMEASFQLLEFDPVHDVVFPDIVHTESLTVSQFLDEKITHMYRLAFGGMARVALDSAESMEFIAQARAVWR
ncbi:helix-turn-helix domain-containing protein [Actinomadura nitritigenes]|uniref:Helix-turn-helix domain-containing protein n=1 Tax=Actinomadura nitritigenes TaxID=134602 RepID=A0ABS3R1K4_9ACTN|nr:helix-turn-helix transcriptional regulator [Actinomadura nitritigenes]MBO2440071.1 helix-turn-helix domain-containing protein [Actinomadura nitritigenes]